MWVQELREMKSRLIINWDEAHQRKMGIVLFILLAVLSLVALIKVLMSM